MFGNFKALLAAHLCLSFCPAARGLVVFSTYALPVIWALASIPLAQLMLLSVGVGMTQGRFFYKLSIAIVATLFLAIWSALGEYWGFPDEPSALPFYQRIALSMLALLIILSLIMTFASRFLGAIRLATPTELQATVGRPQYSVFALLAITTIAALVLGLVRRSQEDLAETFSIAQHLLMVVVFVINILTTIWATLGTGNIRSRLAVISVVALLLGLSLAIGLGNTLETGPWWLFASTTLLVLVPTAIVALTLLAIRAKGYRLLPRVVSDLTV